MIQCWQNEQEQFCYIDFYFQKSRCHVKILILWKIAISKCSAAAGAQEAWGIGVFIHFLAYISEKKLIFQNEDKINIVQLTQEYKGFYSKPLIVFIYFILFYLFVFDRRQISGARPRHEHIVTTNVFSDKWIFYLNISKCTHSIPPIDFLFSWSRHQHFVNFSVQ